MAQYVKKGLLLSSFLLFCLTTFSQTYFAVFNKNNLTEYTAYNISASISDLNSAISSRKSNGYILSSVTYTDEGWFSVYSKGSEFTEGILLYSSSISDLRSQISSKWESEYNLGPVSYGVGYWVAIMYKSSTHYTSSYNTADTQSELYAEINQRINEGFLLVGIAYNGTNYFSAFRKSYGSSECKYVRSSSKGGIAELIKGNWGKGLDLYNVFYINNEYIAVLHKASHLTTSAYNYEVDLTVLRNVIKSRWNDEYDLAHLAFEPSSTSSIVTTNIEQPEVKKEVAKVKTVFSVGETTWNIKNLSVTQFRNGDEIPLVASEEEWFSASQNGQPAYCYVNGDPSTVSEYGLLYNWYAVHDVRGIAPQGFRLATEADFNSLSVEVSNNSGLNNSSLITDYGFFYAGCRVYKGQFRYFNLNSMWWAKIDPNQVAICYKFDPSSRQLTKQEFFKGIGLPVKIVKE